MYSILYNHYTEFQTLYLLVAAGCQCQIRVPGSIPVKTNIIFFFGSYCNYLFFQGFFIQGLKCKRCVSEYSTNMVIFRFVGIATRLLILCCVRGTATLNIFFLILNRARERIVWHLQESQLNAFSFFIYIFPQMEMDDI